MEANLFFFFDEDMENPPQKPRGEFQRTHEHKAAWL